ncbi:hypothetical protein M5K25_006433 [Dendrobium thyrsiflorum]|uniref:Uncharacterized protein n=1 Tax=Dendrobium thyrsiflorum TaxID=117978 RepID=A0ABD0VCL4_DENTH
MQSSKSSLPNRCGGIDPYHDIFVNQFEFDFYQLLIKQLAKSRVKKELTSAYCSYMTPSNLIGMPLGAHNNPLSAPNQHLLAPYLHSLAFPHILLLSPLSGKVPDEVFPFSLPRFPPPLPPDGFQSWCFSLPALSHRTPSIEFETPTSSSSYPVDRPLALPWKTFFPPRRKTAKTVEKLRKSERKLEKILFLLMKSFPLKLEIGQFLKEANESEKVENDTPLARRNDNRSLLKNLPLISVKNEEDDSKVEIIVYLLLSQMMQHNSSIQTLKNRISEVSKLLIEENAKRETTEVTAKKRKEQIFKKETPLKPTPTPETWGLGYRRTKQF